MAQVTSVLPGPCGERVKSMVLSQAIGAVITSDMVTRLGADGSMMVMLPLPTFLLPSKS